jgi:hypothetical protein
MQGGINLIATVLIISAFTRPELARRFFKACPRRFVEQLSHYATNFRTLFFRQQMIL